MASEEVWDFFISFAWPDHARSEELADLLEGQGWRVFFAGRAIGPGATWNDELMRALKGSRVVVVLLSEHTATAHFQKEEITLAIRLARSPAAVRVVPVYLNGIPQEPASWEFGLFSFQRIDLRQVGPLDTVNQLSDLLLDPPPTADPEQDRQERHTVGEMLHGASLRIDRKDQWLPLVEICASTENALFLLHGPEQQNLDLFVSRVWHFLAQDTHLHHRPYVVPLRVEYAQPRSVAAWENHLRVGLGGEGRGGTAEDLLREAARAHPVFLVLSRLPIGAKDLEPVEVEALEEFLSVRLPRLIAEASRDRHPIRALLATHYETAEESLVKRLDERACRGAELHGVRYRKLPPLRPLTWDDIDDFLNDLPKRPPATIYQQLQEAFESLDHGSLQYRDVVELLERQLY